jgi:hypothetical protein
MNVILTTVNVFVFSIYCLLFYKTYIKFIGDYVSLRIVKHSNYRRKLQIKD